MKRGGFAGRVLLVLALCGVPAHASDPMALYARVDRVVLQPDGGQPETIQVWGVFALAVPDDRTAYLPPARGYLYFKLNGQTAAARSEWADLKRIAGSGEIVALGSRYELKARLRAANETPDQPDPYIVSVGLMRGRDGSTNPPVRALREFAR
jgi:hypothetical protein